MNNSREIKAVFLDRDGTICGDDTVHYPGKFKLFPFTQELISNLKKDGIKVFSFTNQPGISAGKAATHDYVEELTAFGFDDIFICPHHPSKGCFCRKPNTGMLQTAAEKHKLSLENCVVIGDRWSDMLAASTAGCVKILVKTGAGHAALNEHFDKINDIELEYIAENLEDAVDWLYQEYKIT
ncbi:HAD-IIIA family hydrolase [Gracilibacillus caseinilyticus]|uniref:D,D-heptose 1,7-bisphosphate phosphatase n=1 Tax=Gracilibacillus caseinilyticus TaxID=2932256 RepID=A0ABY4EXJ0_9BACI|nr:HAD-IIIA family hydrolase [Gracilibacillus caseinilyticus]UOQ46871.1 HAD-IIIA family hydrolase [Gracilibacillus caseinilyticus]